MDVYDLALVVSAAWLLYVCFREGNMGKRDTLQVYSYADLLNSLATERLNLKYYFTLLASKQLLDIHTYKYMFTCNFNNH